MLGFLSSPHLDTLQSHLAKLVTSIPSLHSDSADLYFRNISKQTRELLLYGLFKNDKVCKYI